MKHLYLDMNIYNRPHDDQMQPQRRRWLMMTPMTDIQVRNKGFRILFQELGSVDTIRFLSQIPYEIRDYMKIQEELFKELTIDELYERAREYHAQKAVSWTEKRLTVKDASARITMLLLCGLFFCMEHGERMMKKPLQERYEYDRESDLLDVYFEEKRPAWTIELTDHIMLSLDRATGHAVSLSFLDFTELIRPTPFGLKSFPLKGLADLPNIERELVMHALNSMPVNKWLDVSVVQTMPDSPFIITHIESSISQTLDILPIAA